MMGTGHMCTQPRKGVKIALSSSNITPRRLLLVIVTVVVFGNASAFFPGGRLITRGTKFILNRRPKFRRVEMKKEDPQRRGKTMGAPPITGRQPSEDSMPLNLLETEKKPEEEKPAKATQKKPPENALAGFGKAFLGLFPSYRSPEEIRKLEEQKRNRQANRSISPINGAERLTKATSADSQVAKSTEKTANRSAGNVKTEENATPNKTAKAVDAATKIEEVSTLETMEAGVNVEETKPLQQPEKQVSKPRTANSLAKVEEKKTLSQPAKQVVKPEPKVEDKKTAPQPKQVVEPKAVDSNVKVEEAKPPAKQKGFGSVIGKATPLSTADSVEKTGKPKAGETDEENDTLPDDVFLDAIRIAQKGVDGKIAGFSIDKVLVEEEEEVAEPSRVIEKSQEGKKEDVDQEAMAAATRKAVESYSKRVESYSKPVSEQDEPSKVDFSAMTVAQLKKELGERGLKKGGRKAALISRLEAFEIGDSLGATADSAPVESPSSSNGNPNAPAPYSDMKVAELRTELRKRGLTTGGRKSEVISRLEKFDAHDAAFEPVVPQDPNAGPPVMNYASMTVALLKDELRKRDLPRGGRKAILIARLEENDRIAKEKPQGSESGEDEQLFNIDLGAVDDVAQAARDAVDQKFEYGNNGGNELFGSEESFDIDFDAIIGAASSAREAVDLFKVANNGVQDNNPTRGNSETHPKERANGVATEEVFSNGNLREWSKLSIQDLRMELASRGLNPVGSKIELIASLEASDIQMMVEGSQGAQDDTVLGNWALEALNKVGKDAVLNFEAEDEPSDEALWEIEHEMDVDEDFEIPEDILKMGNLPATSPTPDYDSMAVSQLKAELKSRGLRVTGKKIDLIARLQESD